MSNSKPATRYYYLYINLGIEFLLHVIWQPANSRQLTRLLAVWEVRGSTLGTGSSPYCLYFTESSMNFLCKCCDCHNTSLHGSLLSILSPHHISNPSPTSMELTALPTVSATWTWKFKLFIPFWEATFNTVLINTLKCMAKISKIFVTQILTFM